MGKRDRANDTRLVMQYRQRRSDIDPVLRFVEKLLQALEGRVGLDPAKPVLVGTEEAGYFMRVRAVDAGFATAKPSDCFKVRGIAMPKPEVALAGAAREDHLAEASDLFAVAGPGPVLLES